MFVYLRSYLRSPRVAWIARIARIDRIDRIAQIARMARIARICLDSLIPMPYNTRHQPDAIHDAISVLRSLSLPLWPCSRF